VLLVDRALLAGIRFVLDTVERAARNEAEDPAALRGRLLEAQLRFELGELDRAALEREEREIQERLRAVQGGPIGRALETSDGLGVEISVGGDEGELAPEPAAAPRPPGTRRRRARRA